MVAMMAAFRLFYVVVSLLFLQCQFSCLEAIVRERFNHVLPFT